MYESKVYRWLLDVDPLWSTAVDEREPPKGATSRWAQGEGARTALDLLPPDERARVLRFYRPIDAKLSLGSFLLKHRAIATTCGIAWSEALISADSNKKPCHKPLDTEAKTLEFNVSHHGTLVALVGCAGTAVKLGVDIVRMNWEKDYATVMKDGFQAWANIYEMVFSEREINDIAGFEPPLPSDPREKIRAQLRHFYAHWCLKEAYVKMTGEALLAPWLKDLEFRNVQVPMPNSQLQHGPQQDGDWGQTCTDVEIWFHGNRVSDVKLEIQALRDDYMVATSSSNVDAFLSAFEELDLERDVLP